MARRSSHADDPLGANTSISMVLQAARASLKEPSRPFTPADPSRRLFSGQDYDSRPSSSYGMPNSRQFMEGIGKGSTVPKLEPLVPRSGSSSSGAGGELERPGTGGRGPRRGSRELERPPSWGAGGELERPGTSGGGRPGSAGMGMGMGLTPRSSRGSSRADPISAREMIPQPLMTPRGEAEGGGMAEVFTLDGDGGGSSSSDDEDMARGGGGGGRRRGVLDERSLNGRVAGEVEAGVGGGGALDSWKAPEEDERLVEWRGNLEAALLAVDAETTALLARGGGGDGAAPAPLLAGLDALRTLLDQGSQEMEWLRWLAAPTQIGVAGLPAGRAGGRGGVACVRDAVQAPLFRLMDCKSPHVLLRGVSVLLKVVSGQTLLTTFKLLFRLSKDSANDPHFRKEGLYGPMLNLAGAAASTAPDAPQPPLELLVYVVGVLKNTSSLDSANQKHLVKSRAVPLLASLLHSKCAASGEGGGRPGTADGRPGTAGGRRVGDSTAQLAVQVTGALRNLAVSSAHIKEFVGARVVGVLGEVMSAFPSHAELMLNCTRILSKLSNHEECRHALGKPEVAALVRMFELHAGHAALVVRSAFVLGNLTHSNNSKRLLVALELGGLDLIVSILKRYRWPDANATGAERPGTAAAMAAMAMSDEGEWKSEGGGDGGWAEPWPGAGTPREEGEGAAAAVAAAGSVEVGGGEPWPGAGALPTALPFGGGGGGGGGDGDGGIERPKTPSARPPEGGRPSTPGAGGRPGSGRPGTAGGGGRPGSRGGRAAGGAAGGGGGGTTPEEVQVKLIRLVANLSIHPDVGAQAASSDLLAAVLLSVLEDFTLNDQEELVLNAVSAVTNLCFYEVPFNRVLSMREPLAKLMVPMLLSHNHEAVGEVARCYGNLSRYAEVRDLMAGGRVLEALAILLDHPSRDVLYSLVGALINVSADGAHKPALLALGLVPRLGEVLDRCCEAGDLVLAAVVGKVLYNVAAPDEGMGEDDEEGGGGGDGGGGGGGTPPAGEAAFTATEVTELTRVILQLRAVGKGVVEEGAARAATPGGAGRVASGRARERQLAEVHEWMELSGHVLEALQCASIREEGAYEGGEGSSSGSLEPLEPPPG